MVILFENVFPTEHAAEYRGTFLYSLASSLVVSLSIPDIISSLLKALTP